MGGILFLRIFDKNFTYEHETYIEFGQRSD